jgi:hypothetical protein
VISLGLACFRGAYLRTKDFISEVGCHDNDEIHGGFAEVASSLLSAAAS